MSSEVESNVSEVIDKATENVETLKQSAETNNDNGQTNDDLTQIKDIYEFTVNDIDGNAVSLSKYRDYVLLVVNVASNCGLTRSNYNQLNQLFEKYEKDGLRIAAFPCNQFAGQEPGCNVDIKNFAEKYNVKFDLYSKIDVNGSTAHPLYRWLKAKQRGIFGTQAIKWNFTKFLINKNGSPVKRYAPIATPSSIEPDIKELLGLSP